MAKSGLKPGDPLAVDVQNLDRLQRVLAAFQSRLQELEAAIARIERRLPVTDGELLAAIWHAIGAETFTQLELKEHAEVDPALRETLARLPTALGLTLRRLAERPCGGLTLTRIKRELSGWRWEVTTRDGM
jgi:hypothetical protein